MTPCDKSINGSRAKNIRPFSPTRLMPPEIAATRSLTFAGIHVENTLEPVPLLTAVTAGHGEGESNDSGDERSSTGFFRSFGNGETFEKNCNITFAHPNEIDYLFF